MRPTRALRSSLVALLLLSFGLVSWTGCGGKPKTGTDATPVDPTVAAQQNKAMQDYYSSKMKKQPGRRK